MGLRRRSGGGGASGPAGATPQQVAAGVITGNVEGSPDDWLADLPDPIPAEAAERIAYELGTSTDALTEVLEKAEQGIVALNLGVRGCVVLDEDEGGERLLTFCKQGSAWKLIVESGPFGDGEYMTSPVVNASREVRVLAAKTAESARILRVRVFIDFWNFQLATKRWTSGFLRGLEEARAVPFDARSSSGPTRLCLKSRRPSPLRLVQPEGSGREVAQLVEHPRQISRGASSGARAQGEVAAEMSWVPRNNWEVPQVRRRHGRYDRKGDRHGDRDGHDPPRVGGIV